MHCNNFFGEKKRNFFDNQVAVARTFFDCFPCVAAGAAASEQAVPSQPSLMFETASCLFPSLSHLPRILRLFLSRSTRPG